MPVKDVLSANVEEGRVSDGRASKEKSGAAEALGDSEYFPCNGIDVVGSIDGSLKRNLTMDKRDQFDTQTRTRESFQKMPSRSVYLKRVHMIARLRNAL